MKRRPGFCLALLLPVLLLGCEEPRADTEHPKIYSQDAITFSYPSNWEVTGDESDGTVRSIIVESPGNAIVVVQQLAAEHALDLDDFVALFSEIRSGELPVGEAASLSVEAVDREVGGVMREGRLEALNISLLGQDVPHSCLYFAIPGTAYTTYLIAQAPEEDMPQVEDGFNLVFRSIRF